VGRGREIMAADLTPGQRERLLQKLQRHLEESKITVVSTAPQFGRACILYGAEEGLFATGHAGRGPGKKTMVLSRYIGGCGTGRCYCAIQPNGIITPCVYIPGLKVGDLRQQTLAQIWQNPLFATLADREDRGDHCGICDYRHYCGGCRARAFAYAGDLQAGDPGCVYNYHQWQELSNGTAQSRAAKALSPADAAIGTNQLVQLVAATGAVRAAAESGQVTDLSEAEVREADTQSKRAQSLFQ
jgi:radical SAM protein with 4Fe4S-binding SPASM domain